MRMTWTMESDGGAEAKRIATGLRNVFPGYKPAISETRIEDGDDVKFVSDYKIVTFQSDFGKQKIGEEMQELMDWIRKSLKKAIIIKPEYVRELEMGDKVLARLYAFRHWNDETKRADADFFIVERKEWL